MVGDAVGEYGLSHYEWWATRRWKSMHWNSIMKKPIGPPRNPERSSGPRQPLERAGLFCLVAHHLWRGR